MSLLKTISHTLLISFFLTLPLQGCANNKAPEMDKTWTVCNEPRPQVCTREYRPVCAKLEDGSRKTYGNGCTACSDPKVMGYVDKACSK